MTSDLKPLHAVRDRNAQGSVVLSDAHAPILTVLHLLEVQRGMYRIMTKKLVVLSRQNLYRARKNPETIPEFARGIVFQISIAFPALYSARASVARTSSLPACASSSI